MHPVKCFGGSPPPPPTEAGKILGGGGTSPPQAPHGPPMAQKLNTLHIHVSYSYCTILNKEVNNCGKQRMRNSRATISASTIERTGSRARRW